MGSYKQHERLQASGDLREILRAGTDEITPITPGRSRLRGLVPLGVDTSNGNEVNWDPSPERGAANPHLMIIGESGFGKTYALHCIVTELALRAMRSIIIDFGRGFDLDTASAEFIKYAMPREVLVSQHGINLNPLQIHPSDTNGPLNVAVRTADCFGRIYRIGIQQHALLRDLILELFTEFGIQRSAPTTWNRAAPTLSDLNRKLDQVSSAGSDRRSAKTQSLKSHISTFFLFDTFRSTGEIVSWGDLGQGNSTLIVQLRGLEDRIQKVVMEFLLWDLFHYLRRRGPHALDSFCVLDEAHNLSFHADGPIDKLVREARKFGLGLILASQQPTDFGRTVFGNTASKLIFQTFDQGNRLSRQLANKCIIRTDPELLAREIAQLQKGEALFFANNQISKVKITSLPKRALEVIGSS